MAVQTTYPETMRNAVAGMVADMAAATLISRTVETAAGLAFGIAVEQGTLDGQCKLYDGGKILGITVRERSLASEQSKFLQYESARIMISGPIWVTVAVDVVAGDDVWVRPSNNTFQKDNTNAGIQILEARYDTTALAGALALVRMK